MNTKNKVKYSGMVQLVDEWAGTKTDFVVKVKNGSIIIKEDKPVIKNLWTNEQKQDLDNRFAEQKTYIDNRFAEQKTYIDKRFAEQDKKIDQKFAEQDKKFDSIMEILKDIKSNQEQKR